MGLKPNSNGGIFHAVVRLAFIIASIVALAMAAQCIHVSHRAMPALVIVGSVIAIVTDILSIFSYNGRSHTYPFTMVGDAFAAVAYGVAFTLLAHMYANDILNGAADPNKYTWDDYLADNAIARTAKTSFVLAMFRIASFLGTAILGFFMTRHWNKQDFRSMNNVRMRQYA
ncbi:hypothetical protein SBRCBS47491_002438 [Sporothrix bragantina]|uniref:MARVEL domain-containing protein n=1 Tax=Sporothrix bragantina TaxID=671064 RepID=A0ABP0B7N4_9PEZI